MNKVYTVISDINKALAFEWIALGLHSKFQLEFLLLNQENSALEHFLVQHKIPFRRISSKNRLALIFILWRHFKKAPPDVVHTHLRTATVCGILAAWFARVPKRIYTRHHGSIHHKDFPQAVKIDKLINRLCSDVVSISPSTTEILRDWEACPKHKIREIPHGFDLELFRTHNAVAIKRLREKYNPNHRSPVVGCISRYIDWKDVPRVVEAFQEVLKHHPKALMLLANASGPDASLVKEVLKKLPESSYVEINFESDIASLYNILDVLVHVPIDPYVEAFGQTYIEAMAAGVPLVCTLSGIGREVCKQRETAWVVPYSNTAAITAGVIEILQNSELREHLIINARKEAKQFGLSPFIRRLNSLYHE